MGVSKVMGVPLFIIQVMDDHFSMETSGLWASFILGHLHNL